MRATRTGPTLSISQVERDTGLSKDTLRMWERRYGFPHPGRDTHGERQYDAAQVHKLRLLKRLIDAGKRPGGLVGKTLAELQTLGAEQPATSPASVSRESHGEIIELLQSRDSPALHQKLSQMLLRKGLQQFVLTTLAPLNVTIGEAWARGDIATFDEHVYTEHVQTLLRAVIHNTARRMEGPRVLLTTLPLEQHGIGLLMVEALLAVDGVQCVSLGTQTPLQDVIAAAVAHRADVVALSFSASHSTRAAAAGIATLRKELPPDAAIWVGGRLTARLKQMPAGVSRFVSLEELLPAVNAWRESAAKRT